MEFGLLPDFLQNFSMPGERHYFCMEGSMQGEIQPSQYEIETNIGKLRKTQNSFLGGGTFGDYI